MDFNRIVLLTLFIFSILACKEQPKKVENATAEPEIDYLQKGKEITQASFKALSSKLSEQMKLGGPKQAIPFCNVEALPLTDSLSKQHQVTIKRTSDKIRNPKNKPTEKELEIIAEYKRLKANGVVLQPMTEKDEEGITHFYAPIVTNAKCLKCHGKVGEMVSVKTDSILKSLYPQDMAIGYGDTEVRGLWSLTFNN